MSDEEYVPKPKLKKIERKLVPVLEKLVVEELTETNPYQKFNQSLDKVFENVEDMDLSLDVGMYHFTVNYSRRWAMNITE